MAKPNPFAKKGSKGMFEQSRFDKEKPGSKEGSKKEMAADRRQAPAAGFKGGKFGRK